MKAYYQNQKESVSYLLTFITLTLKYKITVLQFTSEASCTEMPVEMNGLDYVGELAWPCEVDPTHQWCDLQVHTAFWFLVDMIGAPLFCHAALLWIQGTMD